ncbi:MAG TPA: hypothetical protein ENI85_07575 [Deltaproteobacteria bacterium]|nr:hypothetical protein [Deltaproteobacteria bacterium]
MTGPHGQSRAGRRGFSIVELVTVIALTGILTVGLANVLQHPMNGYAAVSRRSELVALADLAIGRMVRDLRRALPNSVRVSSSGRVLELLHTSGGGRYRADPGVNDPGGPNEVDHSNGSDWLSFGGDTSFNLIGRFQNPAFIRGEALPSGTRIAIYPSSAGIWTEAALGTNPGSITPASTTLSLADDGDEDQLQLSQEHRFALESPNARLYLVDTPITFLCDPVEGTLWRIEGYPVTSSQPTDPALPPLSDGSHARAADRLESCAFDYVPGSPSRSGLVTLTLVLASGNERVRLLQQVEIRNAP